MSEVNEMSMERKKRIEDIAKKCGMSFAEAKKMLEEIEDEEDDPNEILSETWGTLW